MFYGTWFSSSSTPHIKCWPSINKIHRPNYKSHTTLNHLWLFYEKMTKRITKHKISSREQYKFDIVNASFMVKSCVSRFKILKKCYKHERWEWKLSHTSKTKNFIPIKYLKCHGSYFCFATIIILCLTYYNNMYIVYTKTIKMLLHTKI